MGRIERTVTITDHIRYEAPAYGAPWKNETHHIWKMLSDDGTLYVWKTTGWFGKEVRVSDPKCPDLVRTEYIGVAKGDIVKIAASFKGMKEYKGVLETEVSRVRLIDKLFDAEADREAKRLAKEAAKEAAKKALLDSVTDGDEIVTMTYARYKAHYADCETVPDSYRDVKNSNGFRLSDPTIDVIVRAGRMKASGVRGKHFKTYWVRFVDVDGVEKSQGYYAVSYENAEKRCAKDYPGATGFSFDHASHYSARWID